MIKNINAGPYLEVNNYGSDYVNSVPSSYNAPGFGMVRYNAVSGSLETYDGTKWVNILSSVNIGLSKDALDLLEWAKEERNRQLKYRLLAKDNVTIADALEKVQDAESKLREIVILCETTEH